MGVSPMTGSEITLGACTDSVEETAVRHMGKARPELAEGMPMIQYKPRPRFGLFLSNNKTGSD
jgi:hypothetical protein